MKATPIFATIALSLWFAGAGNAAPEENPVAKPVSAKSQTAVKQQDPETKEPRQPTKTPTALSGKSEMPASEVESHPKINEPRTPANYEARTRAALKKVVPKAPPVQVKPIAPYKPVIGANTRSALPTSGQTIHQPTHPGISAKPPGLEEPPFHQGSAQISLGGLPFNSRKLGANPPVLGGAMMVNSQHTSGAAALNGSAIKRRP